MLGVDGVGVGVGVAFGVVGVGVGLCVRAGVLDAAGLEGVPTGAAAVPPEPVDAPPPGRLLKGRTTGGVGSGMTGGSGIGPAGGSEVAGLACASAPDPWTSGVSSRAAGVASGRESANAALARRTAIAAAMDALRTCRARRAGPKESARLDAGAAVTPPSPPAVGVAPPAEMAPPVDAPAPDAVAGGGNDAARGSEVVSGRDEDRDGREHETGHVLLDERELAEAFTAASTTVEVVLQLASGG